MVPEVLPYMVANTVCTSMIVFQFIASFRLLKLANIVSNCELLFQSLYNGYER